MVSEGWTSKNGVQTGIPIQKELKRASLAWFSNSNGVMNALVRLVPKGSKMYYKNLTYTEASEMPGSVFTSFTLELTTALLDLLRSIANAKSQFTNARNTPRGSSFVFCRVLLVMVTLEGDPPTRPG